MTRYIPGNEQMAIYDAAMRYQQAGIPLAIIAGKEYGSGSSRDWAAKGPRLQEYGWSSPNHLSVFTAQI